jgi:formyl-CoA transferase
MNLPKKSYEPNARGPLTGLRILDLSRLVCGNVLTMQLADFGAEVIKVEAPEGDPLRAWKVGDVATHWKLYGRNKKSLCLDLRDSASRDVLIALAAKSQGFVESFRPDTLEAIGLGPDILLRANPRLIIVRISGWGQTGPYRRRPGFGTLVEGMSGFAAMNGFADREPVLPPNALADCIAGYVGAAAMLTALREVEVNGGEGQVIDLPLYDPIFSTLGPQAANHALTGEIKQRTGSRSTNSAPRNVYKTRDGGWVSLSASIQAMAERLFRAIGRADLVDDPRYRSNADRVARGAELDVIIGAFIATMDLDQAIAFFEKAEVTIAPVYDIAQITRDPHFLAREIVVEMPDDEAGSFAMNTIVPRLASTPGRFTRPAPKLGEHNNEVLALIR